MLNTSALTNTYYGLRHGHSNPNKEGIIISDVFEGQKPQHGLTELGQKQVRASIEDAVGSRIFDDREILIVQSPLSRTQETGHTAADVLGIPKQLVTAFHLRERSFGDFEGQSSAHYDTVWREDAQNPSHSKFGVESVTSVIAREEKLIEALEERYHDLIIILAGHGDPLQQLETSFKGISPSQHRSLPPLQNAELRRLN